MSNRIVCINSIFGQSFNCVHLVNATSLASLTRIAKNAYLTRADNSDPIPHLEWKVLQKDYTCLETSYM